MSEKQPVQSDVVVIGGGVIGVCTALSLAQRGVPVTLVEKGAVGAEQSTRNWGWCRTAGRDLAEVPLAIESVRMWERFGQSVGFNRAGTALLLTSEAEMQAQSGWLSKAQTYQISSRLLSTDETARLLPEAAQRFAGCLHTPEDGRAEPSIAVQALARHAREAGAIIVERCAARGLDLQAGRVCGVLTEYGRIACGAAVLAGGAWSRLFCGNQGIDFPQLTVLGSVLRTAPMPGPALSVGGANFAFRRRADGGYTIAQRNETETNITPESFRQFRRFAPALFEQRKELRLRLRPRAFLAEWHQPRRWRMDEVTPFETTRVLDPAPSPSNLAQGRAALVRAFPGFAAMQVAASWGGLIDVTPDGVPVIAGISSVPGFHVASGFSGHGFGIGPGAGHLMADLVTSSPPIVDPSPFNFDRFSHLRKPASQLKSSRS